jgi:hypothetical protein
MLVVERIQPYQSMHSFHHGHEDNDDRCRIKQGSFQGRIQPSDSKKKESGNLTLWDFEAYIDPSREAEHNKGTSMQ